MRITPADVENAVLQIFAQRGITAGGCLPLDELRRAWPQTRLRRGDLIPGIKQLVYGGALALAPRDGGALLQLTDAGALRAADLPPVPRGNRLRHVIDRVLAPLVDDEAALAQRRRDDRN